METSHCPDEVMLLEILKQLQGILAAALDSLGGKTPPTRESAYLGWAGVSVNRAAEGYLWLREPGRVAASKLLVRPMLESVFSAAAVMRKKGFLFRKAYTEWDEERKMFGKDAAVKAKYQQMLEGLIQEWRKENPAYPFKRETVSCRDAAEAANLLQVYESAYRIYCKFTHGAMGAVQGRFDEATDAVDTQIVIWCVLEMLIQLQNHTPAKIPDLTPHLKQVAELIPDAFPDVSTI